MVSNKALIAMSGGVDSSVAAHLTMEEGISKLRINGTACLEKYHPKDKDSHQGVYMDIFPCDNAWGTELGRRMQFPPGGGGCPGCG